MRCWYGAALGLGVGSTQAQKLFEQGVLTGTPAPLKFWDDQGSITQHVLHGGKEEGSLVMRISTPELDVYVSPSRGMNIMNMTAKAATGDIFLGWNNPVKGVVNPAYVNLLERDGSGFLEGFNENVARCGYQWAGHAGEDENGEFLTLHGLMANTPAYEVTYAADDEELVVTGMVRLATFKKSNFVVNATLRIPRGGREVHLEDTLTNASDYPQEYMAIYHANFGSPILESESRVYIPARQVSPFNVNAIGGLESYDRMLPPTPTYDETVYNIVPYGNDMNWTLAVLANNAEDTGIAVRWRMNELPLFGLWKNLDTANTGFVVGLEPGTSFSYNRRWNRELGYVPVLPAGESVTFATTFHPLVTAAEVKQGKAEVTEILGQKPTELHEVPLSMQEKETEPNGVGASLAVTLFSLAAFTLLF